MKQFRTEIDIPPSSRRLALHHPVITTGSCFADAIGGYLKKYKFNASTNPFGVTYAPHVIHSQLELAIQNKPVPEHTFITTDGVWYSDQFHSVFSSLSREHLQQRLTDSIEQTHHFLSRAKWISITYGTAWVYVRKDTGDRVANCHKLPAHLFDKELTTQKKMLESFDTLYRQLKSLNPEINILLTVSPVRHSKDTMMLNQVSKSVLRLFCHTVSEHYTDVQYFPAYELMMDDLRDYRFYKRDMIHPSAEAEEYIWEKFTGSFCDAETQSFIKTWTSILNDLHHKPFHPSTPAHQAFLSRLLEKLTALQPLVNVDAEMAIVSKHLTTT